eukprot:CFRG7341T1
MSGQKRWTKIACCQFSANLNDFEANVKRAERLIEKLVPGEIDMLLLPEMAFTGYSFAEAATVQSIAEDKDTGRTVRWAVEKAQMLHAYVVVGYPRMEKNSDGALVYYNSMCVVDRDGVIVSTYDKTHLYETDEKWASEGPGFRCIDTKEFGRIGLGICMDINPYQFTAPFEDFEFANFMLKEKANLIVLIANWLDSEPDSDDSRGVPNYWTHRLKPVLYTDTVFVVCNRSGKEGSVVYTGCSACISLKEPMLLGQLNKRQENVILVDVDLPATVTPPTNVTTLVHTTGNEI